MKRFLGLALFSVALTVVSVAAPGDAEVPGSSAARPRTESVSTLQANASPQFTAFAAGGGWHGANRPGSTAGFDSIQTYTGTYTVPNFDFRGSPNSLWEYQFAGRDPAQGGTTTLSAPVMPVVV